MTLKKQKTVSAKYFLEDGPSKSRLTVAHKERNNKLNARQLLASLEDPEDEELSLDELFDNEVLEEDMAS